MTENIHELIKRIDEELALTGNVYNDESTRYTITGELTPKTESEKKLVNDITYLLRKIQLLKDVLELQLKDNENMMYNFMHTRKQSTIDDAFETIEGDN